MATAPPCEVATRSIWEWPSERKKSSNREAAGSETEIRRARLRAVGASDAEQIDRIDVPVLGKKIKIVPPTEAVAHQSMDEDYGRPGARCRIGGRQVEITHTILPARKPGFSFLQKSPGWWQHRFLAHGWLLRLMQPYCTQENPSNCFCLCRLPRGVQMDSPIFASPRIP